jgi:hypothetical protein
MERLSLVVPDTEQESTSGFMDAFPVMLNAEEAVIGIAELFTESALVAELGVAFPIVSAVIGQWFALGAGYAAARAAVAKENMTSGFSRGVVVAIDYRSGQQLIDYFWKYSPDPNPADAEAGIIGQKAYNRGLVAGFMQGRELNGGQRKWMWRDIVASAGDQSYRGPTSDWSDRDWVDWYIKAAATFRRDHLT